MTKKLLKNNLSAMEVIDRLKLEQSPTGGGWYKFVHSEASIICENCHIPNEQVSSTVFMYLLDENSSHQWHRFRSTLIWSHLSGAPAKLETCNADFTIKMSTIGDDIGLDHQPTTTVSPRVWQRITPAADWSLLSCTHASGFEFAHLEIAAKDWLPSEGKPELSFPAASWA